MHDIECCLEGFGNETGRLSMQYLGCFLKEDYRYSIAAPDSACFIL